MTVFNPSHDSVPSLKVIGTEVVRYMQHERNAVKHGDILR